MLNLNSLHRRRERYCIIYLWKILEGLVPNFSDPIVCSFSDRRGRSCIVSHVNPGRQGTLLSTALGGVQYVYLIDFLSTFLHVLLTGLNLNLTAILELSLTYHLDPDTTTVWMEEMAFNGGHYVMA